MDLLIFIAVILNLVATLYGLALLHEMKISDKTVRQVQGVSSAIGTTTQELKDATAANQPGGAAPPTP